MVGVVTSLPTVPHRPYSPIPLILISCTLRQPIFFSIEYFEDLDYMHFPVRSGQYLRLLQTKESSVKKNTLGAINFAEFSDFKRLCKEWVQNNIVNYKHSTRSQQIV